MTKNELMNLITEYGNYMWDFGDYKSIDNSMRARKVYGVIEAEINKLFEEEKRHEPRN